MHRSSSTELVYFCIKKVQSHSIVPKKIELFNSFKSLQTAVFITYPFSFHLCSIFSFLPLQIKPQTNKMWKHRIPCSKGFTIDSPVSCLILSISNNCLFQSIFLCIPTSSITESLTLSRILVPGSCWSFSDLDN